MAKTLAELYRERRKGQTLYPTLTHRRLERVPTPAGEQGMRFEQAGETEVLGWGSRSTPAGAASGEYAGSGLADLLYARSKAQLGSQYGAAGLRSSSMFGEALGSASVEAQLAGWQYGQQARQQRFNEWQGRQNVQMQKRQLALQRQQMHMAWNQYMGQLDIQDYWQRMDAYGRYAPIGSPPRQNNAMQPRTMQAPQRTLSLADKPAMTRQEIYDRYAQAAAQYAKDSTAYNGRWVQYWQDRLNRYGHGPTGYIWEG